ncbi:MAG: hypothetical protein II875_03390 [Clostridia bacterium]|nr:hypothetical protein [Clostridia bacterium]
MKKRLRTLIVFLLITLTGANAVLAETDNPLLGIWKATRLIMDGEDMDLTGIYGDFISSTAVFDETNSFTIKTELFDDVTRTGGRFILSDAEKVTFYADGSLSAGTYRFEEDVLVLEESVTGKTVIRYLIHETDPEQYLENELAQTAWTDESYTLVFTENGVMYITGGNFDVETYLWEIDDEQLRINAINGDEQHSYIVDIAIRSDSLEMSFKETNRAKSFTKTEYALPEEIRYRTTDSRYADREYYVDPEFADSLEPREDSIATFEFEPTPTPTLTPTPDVGVLPTMTPTPDVWVYPTQSVITVSYYVTADSTWYHTDPNCQKMTGATEVTEAAALAAGKTACPVCIGYYGTLKGTWYHSVSNCQGMQNAITKTKAEWEALGKTACPACLSGSSAPKTGGQSTETQVFGTPDGTYFHVKSDCSGMINAAQMGISRAVNAGKKACPRCVNPSQVYVFATQFGKYYHTRSNCCGMTGAKYVTEKTAIIVGKTPCPICNAKDLSGSSASTSGK